MIIVMKIKRLWLQQTSFRKVGQRMDSVALTIDLALLGVFTIALIMLSVSEARKEKNEQEELKKAA